MLVFCVVYGFTGLPGLTDAQIIATIIGGLLGTACTIVSTIIGVCVYRRQRESLHIHMIYYFRYFK